MSALLVDLGGTHLRCGLSEGAQELRIVRRTRLRGFDGRDGGRIWEDVVAAVAEFNQEVRDAVPAAAPLVISFPGPVLEGRRILDAPTVAGRASDQPDLRALLETRTSRAVHILNDISAAAWQVSTTLAAKRFMVVTVSSGIGSKIFDRSSSQGVLDDVPYAGEIGHLTVDEAPDAPRCDCGGSGHLGAIASGRGIERQARRLAQSDPAFRQSVCALQLGGIPETLNNEEHLVPAARFGDAWALGVVRRCSAPLARVLLAAVFATGVERVVIIGGFALGLGKVYQDLLEEEMAKRCSYRVMSGFLEQLLVMGDDDACLRGAAAFARQMERRWMS